jgi:hypothetical protein
MAKQIRIMNFFPGRMTSSRSIIQHFDLMTHPQRQRSASDEVILGLALEKEGEADSAQNEE